MCANKRRSFVLNSSLTANLANDDDDGGDEDDVNNRQLSGLGSVIRGRLNYFPTTFVGHVQITMINEVDRPSSFSQEGFFYRLSLSDFKVILCR